MKAGLGGGKYEPELEAAQAATGGSVLLIVVEGKKGTGFAVAATLEVIGGIPAPPPGRRRPAGGVDARGRRRGPEALAA
jgi:hypothetical protein